MLNFADHIDSLTSSSREAGGNEVKTSLLDEWTSYRVDSRDVYPLEQAPIGKLWDSVLDVFGFQDIHPMARSVLSNLSSDHISKLYDLLASSHTNDEISREVSELCGLDDTGLGRELVQSRAVVLQQLAGLRFQVSTGVSSASGRSSGCGEVSFDPEDARLRLEETLKANAARPLFTKNATDTPEVLPHVYTSMANISGGGVMSQFGTKYSLPMGTARHDYKDYLEVIVPPAKAVFKRPSERLIAVSELDNLIKGSFAGYTHLNRIQSIVYPTAYGSNENILICAPTGAGKTDVAMLTILRVLDQHRRPGARELPTTPTIDRDSFKIVYVAPMKALASEITQKLRRRLKWLLIQVRELTGDMQLTKSEIAETQIIVTTPEKWDVVTRKPAGEGELGSRLKLLIIDEVHLLNEDRGAVIETIVARTLRQAEASQSVIRIVGLSATLPNYIDVADFLSVSRYTGLFYFDSSFRPIPLEQHFIGIRGKAGSMQAKRNLDQVTFEKVSELVRQGHQVMVFVHARKETVNTAFALKDAAAAEGSLLDYSCEDNPQWNFYRKSIGESRNKEMKQLFYYGFGIHHAGMLRSDRNLIERLFKERAIKVLCCTATLAWGVNLPAHAVIIKGTEVYDSAKGKFVDLSVLDVLQVFGRAGRPGLETSGEGYICTSEEKLSHYLDAVTSQTPIESKFESGMKDALNAEIALGTVSSVSDGVRWLGYTYLFVRMKKNPFQYGLSRETVANNPVLVETRRQAIKQAANQLAKLKMIDFDADAETFTYKRYRTNRGKVLRPSSVHRDMGHILQNRHVRGRCTPHVEYEYRGISVWHDEGPETDRGAQFNQIQVRESEVKELEHLMGLVPCEVYGGMDTNQGKVNILLQAHISRLPIQDFALISDSAYVAQNGGRIMRALLEMAIGRKWANTTVVLATMCKAVEKRMWPFDEPMRQFPLKDNIIYGLTNLHTEYHPKDLASMPAAELGELIRLNEGQGLALLKAAKQFPFPELSASLHPLGPEILKIAVSVTRTFTIKRIVLRESPEVLDVNFIISLVGQSLPSMTVRLISDRWLGADNEHSVSLDDLVMPVISHAHTRRQDVGFLPISSLRLPAIEQLYFSVQCSFLNAIQTQAFWSVINTSANVLLAAPVCSGKSSLAYMAIWSTLLRSQTVAWALVVTPSKAIARSTLSGLSSGAAICGINVEYNNEKTIFNSPRSKVIRVVTAAVLLHALRITHAKSAKPTHPNLVLCENLEQLDDTYELAGHLPTRYIGISRSLNDPTDLASWLGVESRELYSFLPGDREQSLSYSVQTYSMPISEALFKALAKPAYAAMGLGSFTESAIVAVPSRAHCTTIAQELITQHNLNSVTETGFLARTASAIDVEERLGHSEDHIAANFASRGVGIFHRGISDTTRERILELFAEGIIRVLVVTREACWRLPARAGAVVVVGTQYICVNPSTSERQLRDYTLLELTEMQSWAVQQSSPGHFTLFCPVEDGEMFSRFLNDDGLPLESKLLETDLLSRWYRESMEGGTLRNEEDAVQALSFTFMARRLVSNPTYYDVEDSTRDEVLSSISQRLGN
ncbi:Sec63-domain-containing protein [Pisolithus orientalis]|uniref:Sec63-domain-containing protein n=1 Tax=Pisolithus orientalis TaxID=936130 RepID=UPI002225332E|nr:Sec63-domain-containing protein [Pisolithus orientalis]KAI6035267.1 Sec63-domain-containing protein [Pisolithus orientalis]